MNYTSTAADLERRTRQDRWRMSVSLTLNTCIIVGSIFILFKIVGSPIQERRAAERHYCDQLAEQVVAGDLALDRYMTTECPLAILAATEGLDL